MDAARDVMDAVRDVIPVACEALLSKMLLLLMWLCSIPCFNDTAATREALISPTEVEDILLAHPAVQDAVVINMQKNPDEEVPVACVKLKPDFPKLPNESDLLNFAQKTGKINSISVKIVSENIPKTFTGYTNRYTSQLRLGNMKYHVVANGSVKTSIVKDPESLEVPSKTVQDDHYIEIRDNIVVNTSLEEKIPDLTFAEFVLKKFDKFGDRKCLISAETGHYLTFRQVLDKSKRLGSALLKRGFHPRDVLCIYSANHPEFLVAILGVTAIGGVVTLCNPVYTVEELKHQLSHSKASYLLAHKGCAVKAFDAVKDNKDIKVNGAAVVSISKFSPEIFMKSIEKYEVSILPLVPFLVVFLSQSPLFEKYNFSKLKKIICGAAPLNEKQTSGLMARLPHITFNQGFGMTEVSGVGLYDRYAVKCDSVGVPIPGTEVKVLDIQNDNILGIGQDGEICIRGPQVMKGYLDNEQATKDTVDAEGWLHTGDIGHYDKDGMVYIVDRKKELIKYRGLQISPSEIESVILSHSSVRDAGVIGLPDDESGEVPLAFVVLKPGMEYTDADSIITHVNQKVAVYKRLRGGVEIVKEIPRNASGKILRRKLKEMLQLILQPTIDNLKSETTTSNQKRYNIEIKNNILFNKWDISNIPVVSFGEYLMEHLVKYGDKDCIVNSETKKALSFKEVIDQSKAVGSGLLRKGFRPGDTMCIYSPNQPEFLVAILAVTCIGGKVTLCNPAYTKDEIAHQLKHSDASYIICSAASGAKIEETLHNCTKIREIFVFGSYEQFTPFADLLADSGSRFDMYKGTNPRQDILFLPYSSGTTGLPKGVMLSHYNIIANLEQLSAKGTFPLTKDDVSLGLLPFFHIYGLVAILLHTIINGGTVICIPKFTPELFMSSIQTYRVTYLPLVPFLVVFMSQTPLFEKYDISSINRIVSAAAPLSDKQAIALKQKLPDVILNQGYGMTELSPCSMYESFGIDTASTGPPIPGTEVKIVDIHKNETVGEGKTGELCVRGPQVMLGYLNNEEATKNTVDEDGWLHTGDIAYWTSEGLLYIVDRKKELIKYRGMQISPSELESVILKHPAVKDVGIVGLPDETSGELPMAFVVINKDQELTEESLQEYVSSKVAPYKKLRGGVTFIEAVPRNASGKILRRQLKTLMMEITAKDNNERDEKPSQNEGTIIVPISKNGDERVGEESPYDITITDNVICNSMSTYLIPEVSFGEFLINNLSKYSDKTCITQAESGKSFSYSEVLDSAKRISSGLKRIGLSSEDTLFLCCPNIPEFLFALLGVTFVGARVTLCNPVYTSHEMKHQLKSSGATYIICHEVAAGNVRKAITELQQIKEIFVIGREHEGMTNLSVLINDEGDLFELCKTVKPDDVAFLPYSSGTTGLPKGVMLTHRNIISNIIQLSQKGTMPVPDDDVCLSLLPFFHIYGLVVLLMLRIINGGCVVSIAKFSPEVFMSSIEKYKVTTLPLVPFLIVFLTQTPLKSKYSMDSLKRIISGAAPLSDKQALALKSCLPNMTLSQGFGMTELSPVATYDTHGLDVASVGVPIPGTDCKIQTQEKFLGAERCGELLVKGPQIMKGYLNNDKATADTVDEEGWLHTGDIGYWTTKGLVYIVDRKKELIKFRGMQVSPSEIESIILKHEDVKDAGVVGLPDDASGELPLAFVVLKTADAKVTEQDLETFVNNQVAPYKKLRGGVKFVKQIPRSAAGKIFRLKLKMMMVSMVESLEIKIVGREVKTTVAIDGNVVTDTINFVTPDVSFGEFFIACVDKFENATCIIDSISGESYSFKKVLECSKNVATNLRNIGFREKQTVCMCSSSCPQALVTIVGTALCGGQLFISDSNITEDELSNILQTSDATILVTTKEFSGTALKVARDKETLKNIFVFGSDAGLISFDDLMIGDITEFCLPKDITPSKDTFIMLNTVAINGREETVLLSHQNVISNIVQLTVKKSIEVSPLDLCLAPMVLTDPMSLIVGMLFTTVNGGTTVTTSKYDNDSIMETVSRHRIKTLYLQQDQLVSLSKNPSFHTLNNSSLMNIFSNFNGSNDDIMKEIVTKIPTIKVFFSFTSPQTAGVALLAESTNSEATIGAPLPGTECKVISEHDGSILGAEQGGYLVLRGPQVMLGYQSEKNNPVVDGWLHTGLMCYWTGNGLLHVVEDKREIITCDGQQVSPVALEELLRENPDVEDAGVVTVPNAERGHMIVALIVPESNKSVTSSSISEFMKTRVSNHKQISGGVIIVKSIPRTADGEIMRDKLRNIL
ncbi:putative 4-coumarate--CoA ligase 3 [Nymphon striatum]|nr:putative 4-coumarate--CoA ligase 3 [Nymphon striatum]